MAGLCLRRRRRPARDAEIWHGRFARLLRWRPSLAFALRVRCTVRADAERGSFGMKNTLDWLRADPGGVFTDADVVATLNRLGREVEGVENPAQQTPDFSVTMGMTAEKNPQK